MNVRDYLGHLVFRFGLEVPSSAGGGRVGSPDVRHGIKGAESPNWVLQRQSTA